MRRTILLTAPIALMTVLYLTPLHRILHPRAGGGALHVAFDIATVLAVTAPLWTGALWGVRYRPHRYPLLAAVQLPVAALALAPVEFGLRLAVICFGLGVTAMALGASRLRPAPRAARPVYYARTAAR
jgi:hypothetical protein